MTKPILISLTGPDNNVSPMDLAVLSTQYPEVEWAILYFLEREGTPRNPTAAWRDQFLATKPAHCAAHLCGQQVFKDLLDAEQKGPRLRDLGRYSRIQVNINARKVDFTPEQVLGVYECLHTAGLTVILQLHEDSRAVIDTFLRGKSAADLARIHILFDSSRGRGEAPEAWSAPTTINGVVLFCGYAGGLSPANVPVELPRIAAVATSTVTGYWIDMESGIRTDNEFDLAKARKVLEHATSA